MPCFLAADRLLAALPSTLCRCTALDTQHHLATFHVDSEASIEIMAEQAHFFLVRAPSLRREREGEQERSLCPEHSAPEPDQSSCPRSPIPGPLAAELSRQVAPDICSSGFRKG